MADVRIDLRRLRLVLAAIVVALAAGHLLTKVVLRTSSDVLNLNEESTVGTWVSTILLATAAVGFWANGRGVDRARDRAVWWGWRVGAVALGLMSMDEVAMIHERTSDVISDHVHTGGLLFFAWVIPGAVIAIALLGGLVFFARRLERRTAVMLIVGGALFFFGAVGFEMIGGAETQSAITTTAESADTFQDGRLYMATTAIEESLEFVGESLLVYAVARHLQRAIAPSAQPTAAPVATTAAAPVPAAPVPSYAADRRATGDTREATGWTALPPPPPGGPFSRPPDGR